MSHHSEREELIAKTLFESTTAKARETSAHVAQWDTLGDHWRALYVRQARALIEAFPVLALSLDDVQAESEVQVPDPSPLSGGQFVLKRLEARRNREVWVKGARWAVGL